MSQTLNQRIEHVQRAAARLLWLYGWSRFAVAALAAIVSLGMVDYLLRLHHPVARWPLSLVAVGLVAAAFVKLAWPALAFRQNPVATARRIEYRFPQLGERLSSAMAFLSQAEDDPTAGSPGLRRAVVAEAEALSARLDFRDVLDGRASRRASLVAACCLGIAALYAAANPTMGLLSVSRLAMPWREQPWPRRHELVVALPRLRVAAGEDLEIAVIDRRGKLPDAVQIAIRQESSAGPRTVTKEMKLLGEQMVFRIDNVTNGFAFRAYGGDDDTMPWIDVAVVEPPKVVELIVEVEPPEYTGLPAHAGGRVVKGLVGSKLRVRGRVDKSIRSAIARTETPDFPRPAVEVAANGMSFTAPSANSEWLIERSGAIWLELVDAHGLVLGRDIRLEIHAVQDMPPSIAWETPADQCFVTAQAVVPVKGLVKDDVGVRGIQLLYLGTKSGDAEQAVELYTHTSVRPAESSPKSSASEDGHSAFAGDTREFDDGWDLAQIPGLAPGDVLALRITAEDGKQQLATSAVRRLTIITEEQLANRIATAQGAILNQLAETLRLAREARERTSAIETRLRESGQVNSSDLNHLQSAEHSQRQVEQLLDSSPQGALGQLGALLAELAANRTANQAVGERLIDLRRRVGNVNQQSLPKIDQALSAAFKAAREAIDTSGAARGGQTAGDVAAELSKAGAAQGEAIESLQEILGAMTEWDSFSRLAREIAQTRAVEQRLADETEELKLRSIAALAGVPPGDHTMAAQLSQQQLELARSFDKLQTRMEELLARTSKDDQFSAKTLSVALDAARRLAIGGRMREAASQLSQLRLGDAHEMEQVVLDALKQLENALLPDGEAGAAGGQVDQVARRIEGLIAREKIVLGETQRLEAVRSGGSQLDQAQEAAIRKLATEQHVVADETQRVRSELEGVAVFGAALEGAVARMKRAGELLRAGKTEAATQEAEQAALTRLTQILAALQPEEPSAGPSPMPPAEAEQRSPQNSTGDLASRMAQIQLVLALQQEINRRTSELESMRARNDVWTAEHQEELTALAREQGRLAEAMIALAETMAERREANQ